MREERSRERDAYVGCRRRDRKGTERYKLDEKENEEEEVKMRVWKGDKLRKEMLGRKKINAGGGRGNRKELTWRKLNEDGREKKRKRI